MKISLGTRLRDNWPRTYVDFRIPVNIAALGISLIPLVKSSSVRTTEGAAGQLLNLGLGFEVFLLTDHVKRSGLRCKG